MRYLLFYLQFALWLMSCSTHHLPQFTAERWHVDTSTGHAVSTSGQELAFGGEWMITPNTLIFTAEQMDDYPKLSTYLADGVAQFNEIEVDSVLFYHPHRGLLFVEYHQINHCGPHQKFGYTTTLQRFTAKNTPGYLVISPPKP